jgi:murein DD-endopeptidase MepM/ murein hydrolase activator NlpD
MARESERNLRLVGVGAAYGFAAGALTVGLLVWNGAIGLRAPQAARAAVPTADRWQDGMGAIDEPVVSPAATPMTGRATIAPAPPEADAEAVEELEDRDLEIPVEGVRADQLTRSFRDDRSGSRAHEAIDILAPRNTPVKAVEDGRVAKLFTSKAGGITIYQFDPSGRFCYYYAHLERYADGLREGDAIRKGQVVGYVGTSGNAPKETPHLHFAVFRLTPARRWWEGTPLDPYDIFR